VFFWYNLKRENLSRRVYVYFNRDFLISILYELKNELNSKDEKELQDQNEDFLRFKLNKLFKLYEKGEREFSLPEFKKLSYESDGRKYNDFYNSMLYSEICFNYLDRGIIGTFVQNKITEAESEEEIKQKRRAEKIQNLILSMNEEYRLTCPKNACKIRRSERTIKRTVYPSFLLLCF